MLFIQKHFLYLNNNNKFFLNFKNYQNKQIFFKYFLKHKKKRKIFRFTGALIKNKSNIILKVKLHKEIFFINFFLYNPFVFLIKFNFKKKIFYLYKNFFISFLIEVVCSQYIFKKYLFLFKTKYRFR